MMTKEELERQTEELATTFEQALARGGTLVAAWDDVDLDDKTLLLFGVGTDGAKRLAATSAEPKDHEDRADELRARGVRIGQTCSNDQFVWITDDSAITVWSAARVVLEGDRTSLHGACSPVSPSDIRKVVTFYDKTDRGRRGVMFALADGSEVVAVEEHDVAAKNRKPYTDDDLGEDALWASSLGGDLAVWLDVTHDDQIAHVGNADGLRIARIARELAREVEQAPAIGPFEHVIRSLGTIAPAGEVAFRFAPNPLHSERRFLELRVSTPSGKSTAGRWIRQGDNAQIAAFLRGVRTPTTVLRTTTSLLEGLKKDGYA
jgi:hypothetical protein